MAARLLGSRWNNRSVKAHVFERQSTGQRMLEPMTPVPNVVGQRSQAARSNSAPTQVSHEKWHRPVGVADARGRPMIVTEVLAEQAPLVVWKAESPIAGLAGTRGQRWQAVAKRVLDVIGAALGILVCAPLMAILAVAIRLESTGVPGFRQERIGYQGRRFLCLKLRTMRMDAEEQL